MLAAAACAWLLAAVVLHMLHAACTAIKWMHNVLTISRWHAGKKVLVFGHHQEVLNGLQDKFAKEQIGLVRIDGSTDTARRNAAAKQFQSDGKIMVALLSITAAGVRTRVLANQSASAWHTIAPNACLYLCYCHTDLQI